VSDSGNGGPQESGSGLGTPVSTGERALGALLREAHLAAPQEVPALLERHAWELGARDVVAYLADLQQNVLVPFLGPPGPAMTRQVEALEVDSTLAGRAFQHVEVLTQDAPEHRTRVWLPMLDGTERLGVLGVTISDQGALEDLGGLLRTRLLRYTSLAADVIMTKTLYGDIIVRLRRRQEMGLAAEMQWGLLPPLTFASQQITISGALEPAYEVAGDSIDYAVDPGYTRLAVFDGMGHGLNSAHLAVLAVTAYRNARRAGKTLIETAGAIEAAVSTVFRGEAFTTGLLAELDTQTGELRWINAGHPAPLLLRQAGS
jgi:Stage II sporulation protein E (SpoIIE)